MSDPVFGKTWKINKKQSAFTEAPPHSEKRVYEETASGYKLTVSGVHDGKPYEWGYTAGYDGQRCSVYGRTDVDSIEKHKVNDLITIGSFTKRGKTVASYRRATSKNGKRLEVVASGQRPDGSTYFDVLRYTPARA